MSFFTDLTTLKNARNRNIKMEMNVPLDDEKAKEGAKQLIQFPSFSLVLALLDRILEMADKHDWALPEIKLLHGKTQMFLSFKRLPADDGKKAETP